MALLKAEEAFNQLERNAESIKKTSLDDGEKKALKALTNKDIEDAKNKEGMFGQKIFRLKVEKSNGGKYKNVFKDFSLDYILKNFNSQSNSIKYFDKVYDEKGKSKLVEKWIPVEDRSELAVALQFYLIINGEDIRTNDQMRKNKNLASGIDGTIGEVTKQKINDLKNKKTSDKPNGDNGRNGGNDIIDEVKEQSVERLANAIYTEYVGKYNSAAYDLLNTAKGINNGTLKNKTVNESNVTIRYKSAVDNKYYYIDVDASKCKTGKQYSVDKFGKAIENAITAKEGQLQAAEDERKEKEQLDAEHKDIVNAIENFDVKKFTKKSQEYLNEKGYISSGELDFQEGRGQGISFDTNGNLRLGNAFKIKKDDISKFYVNKKFDENKFNGFFGDYLDRTANTYYIAKADGIANNLNTKNIKVNTADVDGWKVIIDKADSEITKIKGLGVDIPEDDIKILSDRKQDLTDLHIYKNLSSDMNAEIDKIESDLNLTGRKRLSRAEENRIIDSATKTYTYLVAHKYSYKTLNVYNVYSKISGGNEEYENLIKRYENIKNMR